MTLWSKKASKQRRCPQVTNCFFCGGNATASKWALLEMCPVTLINNWICRDTDISKYFRETLGIEITGVDCITTILIQSTPVISMPKGLSEILRDNFRETIGHRDNGSRLYIVVIQSTPVISMPKGLSEIISSYTVESRYLDAQGSL